MFCDRQINEEEFNEEESDNPSSESDKEVDKQAAIIQAKEEAFNNNKTGGHI